jgi:predicted SnoaL-like aldol condensation-catalyzing enzyme
LKITKVGGAQRLQELMKQVPDLTVDVRDVIAEGDKVEFHGFVQWRIVEGKFAERWATMTPLGELPEATNIW